MKISFYIRPKCWLFGCVIEQSSGLCNRCAAHLYDDDFIQGGPLNRLWVWWKSLRFIANCRECGKRLPLRGRVHGEFCSMKCYDNWLPF